ncbi:MAG TPA: RsmD family RNA methyltransferase [Acidocella sp.]|jgi:16S rRNA (guanine966-N2)-methyltransferase|uniref:RsmD family RNA methyltransferase n=1 Tax=Acidocella sp. TaxID=50710 RepID=UPI002D10F712|nr:RsmD family RNA methyltransferase [Acidocella sp.]HVE21603.1 RsmD family RNA methyltransferase [Acidocella sp.]
MTQGPKIIAGAWRGRRLVAPAGLETRPTNVRARQAAFDMLLHAPWGGNAFLRQAQVLDVFAGTGAYGLEALSRGALSAVFFERAPAALAALRQNIAACRAEASAQVIAGDALAPPPGRPHQLVFLDPPYGQDYVPRALGALAARGWLAPGAVVLAELGPGDEWAPAMLLAERRHGPARLVFATL